MGKENNPDRPSDGGGGGLGPTGSNSGGANEVVVDHSTVHRDEYISSSSSCLDDAKYSATSTNNSQPFDIFAAYATNPCKSPGEMVPFTSAQWKELERQAMIYKYMISSVPVPPRLLSCVEAGRCKRTDGKKWRCSRDVAPHHKYCERHLHRGRPRSRKPVEQAYNKDNNGDDQNHKKPRLQQTHKQFAAANNTKTDFNSTISTHNGTNRELGSTMESEMVAINETEQKWHHLFETNVGFANEGSSIYGPSLIFHQDYNVGRQLSDHVLSYSDLCASDIDSPVGFVDLNDTNDDLNKEYYLSTNYENFCPWLNLSISMAGGNALDGEDWNVQMRDGVGFCNEDSICWEAFGPGGPLAEALCGNPGFDRGLATGSSASNSKSQFGFEMIIK